MTLVFLLELAQALGPFAVGSAGMIVGFALGLHVGAMLGKEKRR